MHYLSLASLFFPISAAQWLVNDSPYPELVSVRRPFNGLWESPSHPMPSGWNSVTCASATSVFTAMVTEANSTTSEHLLVGCSDGGLFDLTADVALAWSGPSNVDWIFSSGDGPIFAAGASNASLFWVTCNVGGSPGCSATAVGSLPWALGTAVRALTVVSTANSTSVWVSGEAGTAVFRISSEALADVNNGALLTSWLDFPGLAANASAYSSVLGVVALGNWTALSILDAATGALVAWDWVTDVDNGWGAPSK